VAVFDGVTDEVRLLVGPGVLVSVGAELGEGGGAGLEVSPAWHSSRASNDEIARVCLVARRWQRRAPIFAICGRSASLRAFVRSNNCSTIR